MKPAKYTVAIQTLYRVCIAKCCFVPDVPLCVILVSGLAFDSWDLDYYTSMFQKIKRNPTSVECFDLAQSNR